MPSRAERDRDGFEERYLSFARTLCGEGSSKERAKELCKQVREALKPEEQQHHNRIIDQFITQREKLLRQQDVPTTAKAAKYLYPSNSKLESISESGSTWIPFKDLLVQLEAPFLELDALEKALMGVHIHGWSDYQQSAGLFKDSLESLQFDDNNRLSLRAVADRVDSFCDRLITEISRRDSRCSWVITMLEVREAKMDFATWKSILQMKEIMNPGALAEPVVLMRRMARTLSSKASYVRGKICDAVPLDNFFLGCTS